MKVAYHGAPEKAYEVFVSSLLKKQLHYPSLKDQNPAGTYVKLFFSLLVDSLYVDVIMDMLGNPKLRKSILEYYETLEDPRQVQKAVRSGIHHMEDSTKSLLKQALFGDYVDERANSSKSFARMAALEARTSKRLTLVQTIYLPLMFFLQGVLPG